MKGPLPLESSRGLMQDRPSILLYVFLILGITAGAFVFRVSGLVKRPLHTDEAVHAVKTGEFLEHRHYHYDPVDYHGPTLYYAAWPLLRMTGQTRFADISDIVPMRLVPVIFGTLLVLLPLLVIRELGCQQSLAAAVFTAISPAMVFYSRYFIQEILLVCFTFLTLISIGRWWRSQHIGWAILAGTGSGLMLATKETCLVAFVSMFSAGMLTLVWTRQVDRITPSRNRPFPWLHITVGVVTALLVSVACLTGFFMNMVAIPDLLGGLVPYMHRAWTAGSNAGEPGLHDQPWHYYLEILIFSRFGPGPWWSEILILVLSMVGMAGSVLVSRDPSRPMLVPRFLTFFSIMMLIVYSVTPYKTPWLMLGFWHGIILMAGIGLVILLDCLERKISVFTCLIVLGIGICHLGYQAWQASFRFYADTRNPYVYAQTSTNLPELSRRIENLAAVHPDGERILVKVMIPEDDYWPLPWYLRRLENVGYWNRIVENPDGDIIITMPFLESNLDARLEKSYVRSFYGLRPEILLLVLVEENLWETFMSSPVDRVPQEEG